MRISAKEILSDVYFFAKAIKFIAYENAADGKRKNILELDNNWRGGNVRVMVLGDSTVREDAINRLQKYGVRAKGYVFKDDPDVAVIEFYGVPNTDVIVVLHKAAVDNALLFKLHHMTDMLQKQR